MRKIHLKKIIQPTKDYDSVGLWGVAPLITILVFGMILSIFLLIIEKIHHDINKYYQKENEVRKYKPQKHSH